MADPILDAAMTYAAHGWAVIPLYGIEDGICTCRRGAECESPGKHPLWSKWQQMASSDPNVISGWWAAFGDRTVNLGIHCGKSGLVVIDVDGPAGEVKLGTAPPISSPLKVRTRRGFHLYFADEVPAGKLEGIDIKAANGFVVAPPSRHIEGRYEWSV